MALDSPLSIPWLYAFALPFGAVVSIVFVAGAIVAARMLRQDGTGPSQPPSRQIMTAATFNGALTLSVEFANAIAGSLMLAAMLGGVFRIGSDKLDAAKTTLLVIFAVAVHFMARAAYVRFRKD